MTIACSDHAVGRQGAGGTPADFYVNVYNGPFSAGAVRASCADRAEEHDWPGVRARELGQSLNSGCGARGKLGQQVVHPRNLDALVRVDVLGELEDIRLLAAA